MLKIPLIEATISPLILADALWQPVSILAFVVISIAKLLSPKTMLQSIFKSALVFITCNNSKATIYFLNHPLSIRETTPPLPLVKFNVIFVHGPVDKVEPKKFAPPVLLVLEKLA